MGTRNKFSHRVRNGAIKTHETTFRKTSEDGGGGRDNVEDGEVRWMC